MRKVDIPALLASAARMVKRLIVDVRACFGRNRSGRVRERLDRLYGTEESRMHPGLRRLQVRSLSRGFDQP